MSELKARHIVDVYDSYYAENPFVERSQFYLKSEAYKVIALLKDKANYNEYAYKHKSEELADTCRFYEKELRRQKFKRCLAMARWCITEAKVSDDEYRMYWWVEWHKRWMKLAEKFKEKK